MPEVLNVYQLANRYRLPVAWVMAQVDAGTIPHLRVGQRLLFNPAAVAEALARLAAGYPNRGASCPR